MSPEAIKDTCGPDYPRRIFTEGMCFSLSRESRWMRFYEGSPTHSAEVSRLMDGSAVISLADLQKEWPLWTNEEKEEFVHALSTVKPVPENLELRDFISATKQLPEK
jgi:hypothetical protein